MSLLDLFAKDATGPIDLSKLSADGAAANLRKAAQDLVNADERLARAEALVDTIKARRHLLATRTLPDLFDIAQTDIIGVPDAGVDIVVQSFCAASIPKEWSAEKREEAFAHLELHGASDLAKATVEINFPKEDFIKAKKLKDAIEIWFKKAYENASPPVVNLDVSVHHGTLTSWLKKELEKRAERAADGATLTTLDLETIGGKIGRICKVVKRKLDKKPKGKRK